MHLGSDDGIVVLNGSGRLQNLRIETGPQSEVSASHRPADAVGHLTDASEFSEAGQTTLTTPRIPSLALSMSELFAD